MKKEEYLHRIKKSKEARKRLGRGNGVFLPEGFNPLVREMIAKQLGRKAVHKKKRPREMTLAFARLENKEILLRSDFLSSKEKKGVGILLNRISAIKHRERLSRISPKRAAEESHEVSLALYDLLGKEKIEKLRSVIQIVDSELYSHRGN